MNFVLAIKNVTMAAPELANVTLSSNTQWSPSRALANGLPITANGMLVGEAVMAANQPLSLSTLDVAYESVPGIQGGATVSVQFGVALVNGQPQFFFGATPGWGLAVEVDRVPLDTSCFGLVTIAFASE